MWIDYIGLSIVFLLLELLYFVIATKQNIVDKPNNRSSHQYITIRGGGIIFPIASVIFLPFSSLNELLLIGSLLLISVLSFVDDIKSVDSKIRLVIQSIAVIGLLYSFIGVLSVGWLLVFFVIITGVINAYNFMDGINGVTALYSIVTIASLFWISEQVQFLQNSLFFLSILAALTIFSFFNLRKRAKCFAGDVGSVSLAFIICFLVVSLIISTSFPYWILLLSVYGIDTVFTIFCRILRKEPLMKAHRSHFYQYLTNEAGWDHWIVSLLYAGVQAIVDILLIYAYLSQLYLLPIVALFVILIIYVIFRLRFEGKRRLFATYNC